MKELPAGLGEALHMEEPADVWWWWVVVAALLLVLWFRWRNRPRPGPPEVIPPSLPRDPFEAAVEALREARREDGDHRRGCHELSALLREHLGARERVRFDTLTNLEVAARRDRPRVNDVLTELVGPQFGRAVPSAKRFERLCDRAVWAMEQE